MVKELPQDLNYDVSFFISKLDSVKALNDITFSIGVFQGEIDTINKNQKNIEVINKSKEDATILRKKIQIENQEIYNLSIILTFYSHDLIQLNKNISSVKSKFYSKGIKTETAYFKQLECYVDNLPLKVQNSNYLNKLYITTDCLSNLFPFYSLSFIDEDGVIIGLTKRNRICALNIFSDKYENSNMCIFGCSGSGKSYFTKI